MENQTSQIFITINGSSAKVQISVLIICCITLGITEQNRLYMKYKNLLNIAENNVSIVVINEEKCKE